MNENEQHCLDLLRANDQDRYLSVLYAPEAKRGALAALYAFNVEIARIRDVIRDALPGEVRLQWWVDLINGQSHGDAISNPVAAALIAAIKDYNLPVEAFNKYLEARFFDLYNDPMPSRNDLEGYSGETASLLIQMAMFILDREEAVNYNDLAGHAGVAQAITGLIRMLPIHRSRSQIYIPAEILKAAGLSAENFFSSQKSEDFEVVIQAMVALAQEHMAIAKREAANMPKSLLPALLPFCLCDIYLKTILKKQGSAALEVADITPLKRHWIMMKCAITGKV